MSNTLLEMIREQNRLNHLARPGSGSPTISGPDLVDTLTGGEGQEILQQLVRKAIRRRLESALAKFNERLGAMPTTAGSDAPTEVQNLDSVVLHRLDQLVAVIDQLANADGAQAVERVSGELASVKKVVQQSTQNIGATVAGAVAAPLSALAGKIEQALKRIADAETSTAPFDSEGLAELRDQLTRVETTAHEMRKTLDAAAPLGAQVDKLEQRLAGLHQDGMKSIEREFRQSHLQLTERVAKLLGPRELAESQQQLLTQLEERLAHHVDRAANLTVDETATEDLGADIVAVNARAIDTQTVLERIDELEQKMKSRLDGSFHALAAEVSAAMAIPSSTATSSVNPTVTAASNSETPSALPSEIVEMPRHVAALRKEFALLVHTINGHLEDSRDLVNKVTAIMSTLTREALASQVTNS
ncbi:MAG: hypothetical protein ACKVX7_01280 [Planctomycetota bacterium]